MDVFGFKIDKTLSESDHSVVYLTQPEPGRPAKVLKVLKDRYPAPKKSIKYRQEFSILNALNHPHIVKADRLIEKERSYAILFDYFDAKNLEAFVSETKIPIADGLEMAIQITAALNHIHAKQIIHKDICPANILWNPAEKKIRIIGFGISSVLGQEYFPPQVTGKIEGTIAFMSPEQTGRMNRSIDFRSDYYSLGLVLFFIFTGRFPFATKDPLEMIHFHLAKNPPTPVSLRPELPPSISEIILKLISKSADDRYQTANGILQDLVRCRDWFERDGTIPAFKIATHDMSDRVILSQKLYGRENEISFLMQAFRRVAAGGTELVLVAGYSGVGKTSIVNEVHKPITHKSGFFISGKFDQYQRNIPYSAFADAFTRLIHQILALPTAQLEGYKDRLLAGFGKNAAIFTKIVPSLELLIGPQKEETELGPVEIQNIFSRLTTQFINIFATASHPLVIFIDDFQWADLASLKMLSVLLKDSQVKYLLLIGAYRDNEVDESHPLVLTQKEIREKTKALSTIIVAPLQKEHISDYIVDSFHCPRRDARHLAALLMQKTLGNPFFLNLFVKRLCSDRLIVHDPEEKRWRWDIEKIKACEITDNVVELIIGQLMQFDSETKELMMLASCIGGEVSLDWLSLVTGKPLGEIAGLLWPLVSTGLVLPLGGAGKYIQVLKDGVDDSAIQIEKALRIKFSHDRVQQAAYALIPEAETAEFHLKIGRGLEANLDAKDSDRHLFTIVSQFNQAYHLLPEPHQREALARLNLKAAKKAKSTLAYHSAVELLSCAIDMLAATDKRSDEALRFEILFERGECNYCVAQIETAESEFNNLLGLAETKLQKARIYNCLVDLYTTKGEIEKAVKAAISGCELFGIQLYLHPEREQVLQVYEEINALMAGRRAADLLELPHMDNPEMEAALGILAAMMPPALFYDENLLYLEHCHMVRISLLHGNAPASTSGYSYFGMIIGCMLGEYERGYAFGKLGYALSARPGFGRYRAKVCLSFGSNVNFWINHVKSDLQYLEEGFSAALETGDITYSCYHCNHIVMVNLAAGVDLEKVFDDAENRKRYVARTGYEEIVDIIESKQRLVQSLRGETRTGGFFDDATFSESGFEKHLEANMSITVCWYYIHKTQARYLFGHYGDAIAAAQKAETLIWSSVAHVEVPEHYIYYSLALAAEFNNASDARRAKILQLLDTHRSYFATWKASCRDNFEHKYLLIEAELHRVQNRPFEALKGYEQAAKAAHEFDFIQFEALANELAGKLCLESDLKAAGADYLFQAVHLYEKWGALGKARHLEAAFTEVVAQKLLALKSTRPSVTESETLFALTETSGDLVDYKTIVNISRAIATQVDMDLLLNEIMKYTLENTGAEKASILLVEDHGIQVEAMAEVDALETKVWTRAAERTVSECVCESMVRYVSRSGKSLILENASESGDFVNEPYVVKNRCKSILCMPFTYKKGRNRALFLENGKIVDAFPADRVETLRLILPQVSISIENAQLFKELQTAHERLHSLVENSVDAIGVSKSGRNTMINPAFTRLFGYRSEAALMGKAMIDLIAPDHQASFEAHLQKRSRGWEPSTPHETIGVREDGSRVEIEVNASQYGPDGDKSTLIILRDVTRRRAAEMELNQLRNYLTNIIDSMPSMLIGVDLDGKVTQWNTTAQKITGISPADADGRPFSELLPHLSSSADSISESIRRRKVIRIQKQPRKTAGAYGYEDVTIYPLVSNGVEGAVIRVDDISERVRLEELMIQNEKMLSIGGLAAGMAHEINNPIAGILQNTAVLHNRLFTDLPANLRAGEKARIEMPALQRYLELRKIPDMLESISGSGKRAAAIVKNMLAFARKSDQSVSIQNMGTLMDQTLALVETDYNMEKKYDFRKIQIIRNYRAPEALVSCEAGKIQQVFLNLLKNGAEAMAEMDTSQRPPTFTLRVKSDGQWVVVEVEDNGPGIDDSIRRKVFEPFFTTKPVGKGTGLGLSVSYFIITEDHGGQMEVHPADGGGTRFVIRLPKKGVRAS